MTTRCIYKDYCLAPTTTVDEDGRFRARVVVMVLAGDRTRSQRFVDFESYTTRAEADERAIVGGKEWIDAQQAPNDPGLMRRMWHGPSTPP